jgi:glycosyltransferase 2 family protein
MLQMIAISPRIFWFIKSIGILLFIFIILKIDREALVHHLKNANISLVVMAFPLLFATYGAKTMRWKRLISKRSTKPLTLSDAWRMSLIGFFLGHITPGKLGEFGKVAYLKKIGISMLESVFLVILDRVLDVFIIAILGIIGIGILFGMHFTVIGVTATLIPTLLFITLFPRFHRFIFNKTIVYALLWTVVSWTLYFTWAILLAQSVSIIIDYHILTAIFTVAGVISLIPIAPAGLGTRDAALITLLHPYNILAEQAVALAMLMLISILISISVGGWYFLRERHTSFIQ